MKSLILLSLTTALLCGNVLAQDKIDPPKKKEGIMINCGCGNTGKNPLYIIDGKVVTNFNPNALKPDSIKDVSVLKGASATAIYGPKGANGVVVITTKNADNKSLVENKLKGKTDSVKIIGDGSKIIIRGSNALSKELLYVLDDKIMDEASIKELDPNKIQSITVLKDTSAFALYGKKGEKGVVLIATKKETLPQIKK